MARSSRPRQNPSPISSSWSQVRMRTTICEFWLMMPRATKRARLSHTSTTSPSAGLPSTRSIAPEKIHGWRLSTDFSLPFFRITWDVIMVLHHALSLPLVLLDVALVLFPCLGKHVSPVSARQEEQVGSLGRLQHGGNRTCAWAANRAGREARIEVG